MPPYNETNSAEADAYKEELMAKIFRLGYGKCVRLYNEDGKHILSVLRCIDDDTYFDLANPDGKVLCCSTVADYWPVVFADNFPIEDTDR